MDVLCGIGWLTGNVVDDWRAGRAPDLACRATVGDDKLATALGYLREWAEERGLLPSEIAYLARTRDTRPLRFTANGDDDTECAFRTHWVSPALPETRRERLRAQQSKAPDLAVFSSPRDWTCAGCGVDAEAGEFLLEEDGDPLCLACADFDHLTFLPSGDAALSRRARKESTLCVLVLRFDRRRKRYQRRGILVERVALERAEEQCLADTDARLRRRARDAKRRAGQDVAFQARLTDEVRRLFPGCPEQRARAIAEHAGTRGSGRVGRSAAGRALDEDAIRLAVVASVRHQDTAYDDLLMSGVPRALAREEISEQIDRVLRRWESPRGPNRTA
ncbi:DUF2293 domain-containing protein [Qaidamihabitans albus]|uniref:DUF2293 domain-containing protein n=1 Tax=Qaidamihabitans albus TaxID=2795733 RepID=UPI0027DAF169|nr:DUF2293 domain-containing protein [Qaidamihabitans albus]